MEKTSIGGFLFNYHYFCKNYNAEFTFHYYMLYKSFSDNDILMLFINDNFLCGNHLRTIVLKFTHCHDTIMLFFYYHNMVVLSTRWFEYSWYIIIQRKLDMYSNVDMANLRRQLILIDILNTEIIMRMDIMDFCDSFNQ